MSDAAALGPAHIALRQRRFRIAAVHYWQGNWNYNFWSNLVPERLDADFQRIRALRCNTVVLGVPWGLFQTHAMPPRYHEPRFARLLEVVDAAARAGLYVVLRLGTSEWLPEGVTGDNYHVPFLVFDDAELAAHADLFRETAARLAGRDNVLFLFSSWEDMYGHAGLAHGSPEERSRHVERTGPFLRHLSARPLAEWNAAWGTSYGDLAELAYPRLGSPEYAELLRFVDQRLVGVVLPRLASASRAGDPGVRLGFEVRVDWDLFTAPDGQRRWVTHESTWGLSPGIDVLCAYFNPSWGAPNRYDFISPRRALGGLRRMVRALRAHGGGRPVFFDQFNFVDSTPAFRHNSRLRDEDDVAAFLRPALRLVFRRTLGYAIWSLDAYEGNLLWNSSFEEGLHGWSARGAAATAPREGHGHAAVLKAGAALEQTVRADWNPGGASPEIPLTVRIAVRGSEDAVLSVALRSVPGDAADELRRDLEVGRDWRTVSWAWPFRRHFRLELEAVRGEVEVDEVCVSNHVQHASVHDLGGAPLGRRAEVIARANGRWFGG